MASRPRDPVPGAPVRSSRTGRPIMALLDLLGRRWALRVLWELRDEPATFRTLRARCGGVSPTVLNQRVTELRGAGIVIVEPGSGYRLTEEGRSLVHALAPLSDWARQWGDRVSPRRRRTSGTRPRPGG